jgi:hypothetical protein
MRLFDPSWLLAPAQLPGYLAFLLGVTAFLQRDDRRLKLFLVGEAAACVAHFLLLGNPTAAASASVSGARTLLSLRVRSRRLALVVIAAYLALGLALGRTAAGWLPVVGSCFATWGMFTQAGIRMRILVLVSTLLWLANDVLSGSVGGTVLEGFIATVSVVTIARMARARPGADARPFAVGE